VSAGAWSPPVLASCCLGGAKSLTVRSIWFVRSAAQWRRDRRPCSAHYRCLRRPARYRLWQDASGRISVPPGLAASLRQRRLARGSGPCVLQLVLPVQAHSPPSATACRMVFEFPASRGWRRGRHRELPRSARCQATNRLTCWPRGTLGHASGFPRTRTRISDRKSGNALAPSLAFPSLPFPCLPLPFTCVSCALRTSRHQRDTPAALDDITFAKPIFMNTWRTARQLLEAGPPFHAMCLSRIRMALRTLLHEMSAIFFATRDSSCRTSPPTARSRPLSSLDYPLIIPCPPLRNPVRTGSQPPSSHVRRTCIVNANHRP